MEEELGCWFNRVFIICDRCRHRNDADKCAVFRRDNYAKLGHNEKIIDKRDDPWKGGSIS